MKKLKKIIMTFLVISMTIPFTLMSSKFAMAKSQTGLVVSAQYGVGQPYGDFRSPSFIFFRPNYTKNGGQFGGLNLGFDFFMTNFMTLGVETGVQGGDISKSSDRRSRENKVGLVSVPAMVKAKFYLVKGLNVFGKGGVAYNTIITHRDVTNTLSAGFKDSNFDPVVALGLGYAINKVNIFLQYQYNWISAKEFLDPKLKNGGFMSYSAGISYIFSL